MQGEKILIFYGAIRYIQAAGTNAINNLPPGKARLPGFIL